VNVRLTDSSPVVLNLPRFLVVALEQYLADANAVAADDGAGDMDLSEFMTEHFVDLLDTDDLAYLDQRMPGVADAVISHIVGIRVE
jgi:hypothetical protein